MIWAFINKLKKTHSWEMLFTFQKVNRNINKYVLPHIFPKSICLFMFFLKKQLIQQASKSECQQFWSDAVLIFIVSLRLAQSLSLCCALHFPDESHGLRSKVSTYTVILLFAWWTYLFAPGFSHFKVITFPISTSNYRFCSTIKVLKVTRLKLPFKSFLNLIFW